MVETEGRARLVASLSDPSIGLTQTQLANRLGVSQPSVSEWCAGRARPTATYRTALRVLLGIPESDWMTAQEVEQVQALAR